MSLHSILYYYSIIIICSLSSHTRSLFTAIIELSGYIVRPYAGSRSLLSQFPIRSRRLLSTVHVAVHRVSYSRSTWLSRNRSDAGRRRCSSRPCRSARSHGRAASGCSSFSATCPVCRSDSVSVYVMVPVAHRFDSYA